MPEKKQNTLVRTIYLYTFSLLGLIFVIVGTVRLVDMGLKAFVFTKANEDQNLYSRQPYMAPPAEVQKVDTITSTSTDFSPDEVAAMKQWVKEYNSWKEEQSNIDYTAIQQHQEAAGSLSAIIVGLPLYLYHWGVIKKENKERNGEES